MTAEDLGNGTGAHDMRAEAARGGPTRRACLAMIGGTLAALRAGAPAAAGEPARLVRHGGWILRESDARPALRPGGPAARRSGDRPL